MENSNESRLNFKNVENVVAELTLSGSFKCDVVLAGEMEVDSELGI